MLKVQLDLVRTIAGEGDRIRGEFDVCPAHLALASLLVNIGQLAVAVVDLAILIRRK